MIELPLKFWLENAHFVIFGLAGFAFFATGWLYWDSNRGKPDRKILIRAVGFFILTLWALAESISYDAHWVKYAIIAAELLGIGLVAISFYLEPILTKPRKSRTKLIAASPFYLSRIIFLKLPVAVWLLALIRIWRLSTVGYIKNLIGLRTAFLFFFLSGVISIAELFRDNSNLIIFDLTKEYSYFWILENLLVLVAVVLLIKWVFYYIRFRLTPQLFITFASLSFAIAIIIAVVFTGFLFSVAQQNSIDGLKRNAAVFDFSLKELKSQTNLAAYGLSQRDLIIKGVAENNVRKTKKGLGNPLKEINVGGAAVTNRGGEVLAVKGSYLEVGESLIADPTVIKALAGKPAESFVTEKFQDSDQLIVRSAFPIVKNARVIGVVVVDFPIDQVFVDSVKTITDLDVSLHLGVTRVATTFLDKNNRQITGTQITNQEIIQLTEDKKEAWVWSGSENLVGQQYLVAYRSLADVDGINIGSLLTGQSQLSIINEIQQSINFTFLVTTILILISLLPIYLVAKSVSKATRV